DRRPGVGALRGSVSRRGVRRPDAGGDALSASSRPGPERPPAIRPARPEDLGAIARLHVAAFPGAFLSLLGERFLRRYYRLVLESLHGRLLVAADDGAAEPLAGFVAGTLDPAAFRGVLRSAKLELGAP